MECSLNNSIKNPNTSWCQLSELYNAIFIIILYNKYNFKYHYI